ncbi:MAG: hypothetical protein ACQKBU_08010, partial [Verrucomicrobiales bacterium]
FTCCRLPTSDPAGQRQNQSFRLGGNFYKSAKSSIPENLNEPQVNRLPSKQKTGGGNPSTR